MKQRICRLSARSHTHPPHPQLTPSIPSVTTEYKRLYFLFQKAKHSHKEQRQPDRGKKREKEKERKREQEREKERERENQRKREEKRRAGENANETKPTKILLSGKTLCRAQYTQRTATDRVT